MQHPHTQALSINVASLLFQETCSLLLLYCGVHNSIMFTSAHVADMKEDWMHLWSFLAFGSDAFPDTSYHISDTESLSFGQLRADDQWLKANRTVEINQQTYLLLMIHSVFYVLWITLWKCAIQINLPCLTGTGQTSCFSKQNRQSTKNSTLCTQL